MSKDLNAFSQPSTQNNTHIFTQAHSAGQTQKHKEGSQESPWHRARLSVWGSFSHAVFLGNKVIESHYCQGLRVLYYHLAASTTRSGNVMIFCYQPSATRPKTLPLQYNSPFCARRMGLSRCHVLYSARTSWSPQHAHHRGHTWPKTAASRRPHNPLPGSRGELGFPNKACRLCATRRAQATTKTTTTMTVSQIFKPVHI